MRTSDATLAHLVSRLGDDIFVVGLTWSDEGKGKVADELAAGTDASVRWHGGASAGHNIVLPDGMRVHLHNLPCGIVRDQQVCIAGPLCVLDPELVQEEHALSTSLPGVATKIQLDPGAHVVLPAHKQIDAGREQVSATHAYGTTKTGMGPVHEDLFGRRGVTVQDIASGSSAIENRLTLRRYYAEKEALAQFLETKIPSINETVNWCAQFTPLFRSLIADTRRSVHILREFDLPILWEGAHGAMIDVVNGTMSTSSLVSPWSAYHCYGPMRPRTAVVGTFRPYVTRTGPGPMPTEMETNESARLHTDAGEIESTTGRKQRCGWLDLMAVASTARLTGTTHLYLTKMDVMPFETINICINYRRDGKLVPNLITLTADLLENVEPCYVELSGWDCQSVSNARTWHDLPEATQRFIRFIETQLHLPVIAIGNGPVRGDVILTGTENR